MSEPLLPREVRRRLAIIQHAEEVTGNVAMTAATTGSADRPTTPGCGATASCRATGETFIAKVERLGADNSNGPGDI